MTEEGPLLLTEVVAPTPAEWRRANRIFEHQIGCRCSTCRLAAELAFMVRKRDESTG